MTHAETLTRRGVWVDMLLYPAHTLPTAAAPVLVACGLAAHHGVFAPLPALLAFGAGWLIQVGGVIADNYVNLTRHADDTEHAALARAVRTGVVTMRALRSTITACFVLALVVALPLVYLGGVPVLAVGVASVLASLAYSGGPLPLGDNALGDPLFFAFFGVVSVSGAYYVQAAAVVGAPLAVRPVPGVLGPDVFVASLPMAALITSILIIDNIRDMAYDRAKGERTLAVLIGARWSRVELVALVVLAYLAPLWLRWRGGYRSWVLLPLATLPLALPAIHDVIRRRGYEALLPMTPRVGRLTLLYAVLFAIGLAR